MKRLTACALLFLGFSASNLPGQDLTTTALSSPAKEKAKPAEKNSLKAAMGGNLAAPNEAVTTEINADEAFFDSEKYTGIFSGHVIVIDPRFNIQADKLTIYLSKGEQRGLEKAVAEGNVGVVRERPGEKGGAPVRSVGRAESAVYTAKDGNVELKGMPRVQSGLNTHVATSPNTVMLINQSGQLTTRGPSRTEIRQEPKAATPKP